MAANDAPVVSSGPNATIPVQLATTATSSLSGTASDADGDALATQWTQISGPTVSIASPNSLSTNVTFPGVTQQTDFVFEFSATDAAGETSTTTTTYTLVLPNAAPTVDAGPDQNIAGGSTVTLSGSASDSDNDPLTTTWVQTSGPTVTLSDPNTLNPTFTAPARGFNDQVLSFELRADDGTVVSTDTVEITVAGNEAPVAVASITPSSAAGNSTFTLDGSATTDPEGDAIIYQWVQTGGSSGTIADSSAAVTTFTAPAGGAGVNQTLSFELRATDTFDETGTDTATATLLANTAPTADAGLDQDVTGSALVTLDGTASTDPEGDPLTYSWTQTSGPVVTLSNPNAAQPTFTAPASTAADQVLEFQLVVDDGIGGTAQARTSNSDSVSITVLANRGPLADAGADQGPIDAGQTVTLDGTASSDPDGDTLSYSWVQTSGPAVTLSDSNSAEPSFVAPQANGTVTFALTVSDGTLSSTDEVSIEVRAVGSITIIQRIVGTDTQVTFASSLAALSTSVTTNNGTAEVTAQLVPVGTYSVTASDLSASGIAVTDITCSDADSLGDVASRTATIELAAGEDVTCTFTAANSREAAQVAIFNYLTGRNALILANQPDLQRRIDRLAEQGAGRSGSVSAYGIPVPGAEHLPIEATLMPGQARFSSSLAMALGGDNQRVFDLWAEASFSRAEIAGQEADFSIIHLGADIKVNENLLIGAILQFDEFSDRDTLKAGEAEGDGYMVGPYVTAKLTEELFLEARAAWGTSDNVVSPLNGQRDAFETSRSLYSGSLAGQFGLGKATTFRPELTVRYLSEDQKAYTDSLGITIPSQTVDQGDVSFRPRLSHIIETKGTINLRPYAQVEGIYTFGTAPDAALANLLPGTFTDTFGDFRGRVEGGLDLVGDGAFRASISGFYDGIGADGFENKGVRAGISFGF
uniref:PKD domain-containing protein n=1 Tax=uncultured Erythrobacter sp. TaxID=263913 RepID=UPI00260818F3|nr:PKD domain-containing protein [uncultured Erythrobacter sp.]